MAHEVDGNEVNPVPEDLAQLQRQFAEFREFPARLRTAVRGGRLSQFFR